MASLHVAPDAAAVASNSQDPSTGVKRKRSGTQTLASGRSAPNAARNDNKVGIKEEKLEQIEGAPRQEVQPGAASLAPAVQDPVVQHPDPVSHRPAAIVNHAATAASYPASMSQGPASNVDGPAHVMQQPAPAVQRPIPAVQRPGSAIQHAGTAGGRPLIGAQRPPPPIQQRPRVQNGIAHQGTGHQLPVSAAHQQAPDAQAPAHAAQRPPPIHQHSGVHNGTANHRPGIQAPAQAPAAQHQAPFAQGPSPVAQHSADNIRRSNEIEYLRQQTYGLVEQRHRRLHAVHEGADTPGIHVGVGQMGGDNAGNPRAADDHVYEIHATQQHIIRTSWWNWRFSRDLGWVWTEEWVYTTREYPLHLEATVPRP